MSWEVIEPPGMRGTASKGEIRMQSADSLSRGLQRKTPDPTGTVAAARSRCPAGRPRRTRPRTVEVHTAEKGEATEAPRGAPHDRTAPWRVLERRGHVDAAVLWRAEHGTGNSARALGRRSLVTAQRLESWGCVSAMPPAGVL